MFQRYCCLAASLLAVSLYAQEPVALVKGRVIGNEPTFDEYVIELTNLTTRVTVSRVEVSMGGDFTVRGLPYGDYLARIATYHGDTVAQQIINIHESVSPIDLRLPPRSPRPTGATVSARELRTPPRRKAVDASVAAQRFSESGRFDQAATELEKAVRISPEYAAAHSNLGVQYLRLKRYADAEAEIRRAIEIAGANPHDLANLAFAQLGQERFADAAATAREALKLRKDAPTGHLVLGLALVLEPETRGEGIAHLEEAAKTLDSARRTLEALAALKH